MQPNDILKFIDSVPNLTRAIRSIQALEQIPEGREDLLVAQALLSDYKLEDITTCSGVSRFTISQSEIEVVEGFPSYIKFSLKDLSIGNQIGSGDLIQLVCNQYYRERDSQFFTLYQDNETYTSCYLSYVVSNYNLTNNEGYAFITNKIGYDYISLVGSQDDVLRKVSLSQIYKDYYPDIEDAYIL